MEPIPYKGWVQGMGTGSGLVENGIEVIRQVSDPQVKTKVKSDLNLFSTWVQIKNLGLDPFDYQCLNKGLNPF